MEKKIYEKPLISGVIDLDAEVCDIDGESRWTDGENDFYIRNEGDDGFDWDNYELAKKSTLWDDEDDEEE